MQLAQHQGGLHWGAAMASPRAPANGSSSSIGSSPGSRAWCLLEWACTLATHGPDGLHFPLPALGVDDGES